MIEFVTLFLALTWGMRPVEVAVGAEVAAVELPLDGELVGRLEGEPWSLELDSGKTWRPTIWRRSPSTAKATLSARRGRRSTSAARRPRRA